MQPSIILQTVSLSKTYYAGENRVGALRGIDLSVQAGEFVAIMGPSGSGKTTLLNLISTIDRPTEGAIYYEGRDICQMIDRELAKFRRENVGFVFQEYNLLDNLSVEDNIALPLALEGKPARAITERVRELATYFGIADQLKKQPYQLSGGQKQRVAAARALSAAPRVIYADEPTGALDSRSAADLLGCFARLKTELGTTIVMVTHDAFAASFCDRVLFLKDGGLYGRLDNGGERKAFFARILDMQGAMGGAADELL